MVNVVVNSEDINVVNGSQLPSAQSGDFVLFGMSSGSSAKVSKATLEEAMKMDGVGVSQEIVRRDDSELSVDFAERGYGDIIMSSGKVMQLTLSGDRTGRVTCFFQTDKNFEIIANLEEYVIYSNTESFENDTYYMVEVISSKGDGGQTFLLNATQMEQITK